MKANDLRSKSAEDLNTLETELRRKVWKSKFDNLANQLDDSSQIGKARRDLARLLTVRTERAKKS